MKSGEILRASQTLLKTTETLGILYASGLLFGTTELLLNRTARLIKDAHGESGSWDEFGRPLDREVEQ